MWFCEVVDCAVRTGHLSSPHLLLPFRSNMDPNQDLFFIITEKGPGVPSHVHPGDICYISEKRYIQEVNQESNPKIYQLPMKWLGSQGEQRVQVDCLQPLTPVQAAFLQALDTEEERLDAFLEKAALEAAADLKEGCLVFVDDNRIRRHGVVRSIGSRNGRRYPDCTSGTFFRVELQVCLLCEFV